MAIVTAMSLCGKMRAATYTATFEDCCTVRRCHLPGKITFRRQSTAATFVMVILWRQGTGTHILPVLACGFLLPPCPRRSGIDAQKTPGKESTPPDGICMHKMLLSQTFLMRCSAVIYRKEQWAVPLAAALLELRECANRQHKQTVRTRHSNARSGVEQY